MGATRCHRRKVYDRYLFDEGLISGKEADSWADEIWPETEDESEEH